MKLNVLVAATSALLTKSVLAGGPDYPDHHDHISDWSPPCDDEPANTVTRTYTLYLPAETVDVYATKTNYRTRTGDGVVRYTRTTSVSTVLVPFTTTKTITSFNTVATSTQTLTYTSTVRAPRGFVPAKDTVHGFPGNDEEHGWYPKRAVAGAEVENTEQTSETKNGHSPDHHECRDHFGPDGVFTVEKLVTVTPACVTKTHYQTVTRPTTYIPTTISIVSRFSRTTTVSDRTTTTTTVTSPATARRTATTTTLYYAACATNNIILSGPDGHRITNVYNNGRSHPSIYDMAPGTHTNPYECCVACQKSSSCMGSVFRTGDNFCLLLRRGDRQCGSQCENRSEYVSDPDSRGAGLVVSNGQCGYMSFGGNSKPGVPPFCGKAINKAERGPGL